MIVRSRSADLAREVSGPRESLFSVFEFDLTIDEALLRISAGSVVIVTKSQPTAADRVAADIIVIDRSPVFDVIRKR